VITGSFGDNENERLSKERPSQNEDERLHGVTHTILDLIRMNVQAI
jgi:hypothetical protein